LFSLSWAWFDFYLSQSQGPSRLVLWDPQLCAPQIQPACIYIMCWSNISCTSSTFHRGTAILRTILQTRMLKLRKAKSFAWIYIINLEYEFLQIVFYFYYTLLLLSTWLPVVMYYSLTVLCIQITGLQGTERALGLISFTYPFSVCITL